ncbi:substrate-binding periplasmic protein [Pseudoalteromonas sp. S16_S37]|uniref:substrate-binding periplasmic protein n=1 Tax=Pseudoalteromonas sp. S16_S37 TaxID=2720228 RepID=UPI0016809C5F|nr:ABC transporter substrate-binding protein [Pseudoalteromonas sp. S16_S37]MBD1582116.1 amino acid ABC transporter substrate-binding protein [Pseudoalteromonas sp. S16_S37]
MGYSQRLYWIFKHLLGSLLLSSTLLAAQPLVLVSSEGPPHTINDETHSGIDLDVTKAVLKRMGYEVKLLFVPLGRAEVMVKTAEADLMAPIFQTKDTKNFYISDPIVTYKPMVFSLKKAQLSPTSISDLSNYAVITFQGAPGYFGEEFQAMSKKADYIESAQMSVIPNLLSKGRFDFAVLDKYIFYYFYRLNNKERSVERFKEHSFIPPVNASVAFKNAALRDAFNNELIRFKEEKHYERIVNHYLGHIPF